MASNDEVSKEVLSRIKPTEEDRARVEGLAEKMMANIIEVAKGMGVQCKPILVGSVAKGTWIRDPDIDMFMLFPPETKRSDLEKWGLEIGKKVAPDWEERYAEHPYVHARVDGLEMDIVPCYEIRDTSQMMSAVDRTPFHAEFVKKNLREDLKDDVLLLKQFMKGIGVYGAEAKVEGFHGYMTELLTIKYGGFMRVLDEGVRWKRHVRLSLEPHPKEVFSRFDAPMVFIDPVDVNRNVTAALSSQSLATFIHASLEASSHMKIEFFFPRGRGEPDPARMRETIASRGTHVFALRMQRPKLIDDVLYPQVKKCTLAVHDALEGENLSVLRARHFCGVSIVLLFEVDRHKLSAVFTHMGPPVWHENAQEFLAKWKGEGYRPFIRGDRWVVHVKRKFTTPEDVALDAVRTRPIGKDLEKDAKQGCELVKADDTSIARELWEFLDERMPWER